MRNAQAFARRALGDAYEAKGDLVFCRDNGTRHDPDVVSKRFVRHVKKSGMRPLHFHGLRHTSAVIGLRELGEWPDECSRRLGHSSVAFTLETSGHLLPERGHNIAAAFDRLIAERRSKRTPCTTHGGPARVSHRAALAGIVYVLRHGLRWRDLPRELGHGSGSTCWRRLRQWQERGIWQVHQAILDWLGDLDAIDWSRASLDAVSVRAKRGGEHTGPNPTDRRKAGSKFHVLVDRQGVPLAVQLSAANVHDFKLLEPLVDAVQPIRHPAGEPGRPRRRPAKMHGDKGYDYSTCRRALRRRGITPRIARRGVESGEWLGRHRWVVERTQAWLVIFRWLAIRYDRQAASVLAFLHLAGALVCLRYLAHAEAETH